MICPQCTEDHTRREGFRICLAQAKEAVKPFQKCDKERETREEALQMWESLPTEPHSGEFESTTKVIHRFPCPHGETSPHPSQMAVMTMLVTTNVYQCLDCLFLFTDCTSGSSSFTCEQNSCWYWYNGHQLHELVLSHKKIYTATLEYQEEEMQKRIKRKRSKKSRTSSVSKSSLTATLNSLSEEQLSRLSELLK